jgi:predicted DCC family thiol-disulfide oxidoreductase YuxK
MYISSLSFNVEQINKILLFDGICNLCNGFVQFVINRDLDGNIKFAALQSVAGQQQFKRFGLPEKYMESLVYIKGDKYYRKSTAVLYILKDLRGAWQLAFGFMIIPAFIRDFIYGLVAKKRYRIFGKKESCMIPTPELKSRFLE